jgi:hypothetical protein
MWNFLTKQAQDYGFLGPIVGIVCLLMSVGSLILFNFTHRLSNFQPPDDIMIKALKRVVTCLCAIGVFVAWFLADPSNGQAYLRAALWLVGICLVAFLGYLALMLWCGRFKKPESDARGNPTGKEVRIWGGFWLTTAAREARVGGTEVQDFLRGNMYVREKVWPPASLLSATLLTAVALLVLLASGATALSTAAAAIQVALTNKPARAVFGVSSVPGLPEPKESPPQNRSTARP